MDEVDEEEDDEEDEADEDEWRGVAVSAVFVGFVSSSSVLPTVIASWLDGGLAPCARDRSSTTPSG